MKVFISQPMSGLPDEEIASKRDKAIEEIKELFKDNNIEIVSTTYARDGEILPKEADRLWWLGRAIQMLEGVDVIYICNGWENSHGCKVEKCVADEYNIPIYYQGEKDKRKDIKDLNNSNIESWLSSFNTDSASKCFEAVQILKKKYKNKI
jgi:hypothetical protein